MKEHLPRWRFGDGDAYRHLFENLSQTVAFALDLSQQELAFSRGLFMNADVVDHDLCERLAFPVEPDRTDLYSDAPSVFASKYSLDVFSRLVRCHQLFHAVATVITIFRRN